MLQVIATATIGGTVQIRGDAVYFNNTSYTARTSIFGGGYGYTLTATANQATGVQACGWRGSYSDPSGVITKTTFS